MNAYLQIRRGLTKAETESLMSIPGLPGAALEILAGAGRSAAAKTLEITPGAGRSAAAKTLEITPARGVWFRASAEAFGEIQRCGVDHRWGRNMRVVRVPADWAALLPRGRVPAGRVGTAPRRPGGLTP
jgi:hypothetical protein